MSNLADTPIALTPSDVLITLISSLLAPMFLVASNGDVALARLAALQTMDAYRVQHQADVIAVAQILAFGLAALGSLSLSMADDISMPMMLRLRGNANACNRSAEQNRRALQASHQASPVANPWPNQAPQAVPKAPAAPKAPVAEASPPSQASAPAQPAAPAAVAMTEDQRHRAMWAAAFTEVAAEYTAELASLPPEERRAASTRADALASSANALLSDADLSAFALKPLAPNGKPPTA